MCTLYIDISICIQTVPLVDAESATVAIRNPPEGQSHAPGHAGRRLAVLEGARPDCEVHFTDLLELRAANHGKNEPHSAPFFPRDHFGVLKCPRVTVAHRLFVSLNSRGDAPGHAGRRRAVLEGLRPNCEVFFFFVVARQPKVE